MSSGASPPPSKSARLLDKSASAAVKGSTSLVKSACDQCHQKKQRCDGNIPCSRCVKKGLGCKLERLPTSSKSQSFLNSLSLDLALKDSLCASFAQFIQPLLPIKIGSVSAPAASSAERVQQKTGLAMAARGMGLHQIAETLVDEARRESKEFFDVISDECCVAFMMLGYYYAGVSTQKARHYQNISLGLDPQGKGQKNAESSDMLFARMCPVELMAISMTVFFIDLKKG